MLNQIVAWCVAHPEAIIGAVIALLGLIKGKPWVDAVLGDKRATKVLQLAHIAFTAVEEAAVLEPSLDTAAKIALFADKMATAAQAAGLGSLSDHEKELASSYAAAVNYTNRPNASVTVLPSP